MSRLFVLCLALFAAPALAAESAPPPDRDTSEEREKDEEQVKEKDRPVDLDLDERIRPVSGRLYLKSGRHEITPQGSLSLNDAFFTKYLAGLRYSYHLGESFSLGVNGSFVSSSPSGAVARCDESGQGCRPPTKDDLARAPGDFSLLGSLDATWAPLYGKLSLLAETALHFDTYVVGGAGVIQTRIAPPGEAEVATALKPSLHVGFGQRYFIGRGAALRIEVRDVIYQVDIQGRQGPESSTQHQLLFTLGVSFFLGAAEEP